MKKETQLMRDEKENVPFEMEITDILDLHTIAARDVPIVVAEYLFQCVERGFSYIRIIHGKGIGFQREAVRNILSSSPLVKSFEDGPDWGSTAIVLSSRE
jgi:DNA-nicking Smr family endonuclease